MDPRLKAGDDDREYVAASIACGALQPAADAGESERAAPPVPPFHVFGLRPGRQTVQVWPECSSSFRVAFGFFSIAEVTWLVTATS